ncbi:MAG: septal ring lytic transglycosylase RlpA family protein [Desulfobulbaceae bacterium]|nr:septal ring lytic transglycosylase RlpA family protein [Desulfobulbaceae bacterium]
MAALLLLLSGCGPATVTPESSATKIAPTQKPYTIGGRTYYPIPSADGYRETGIASWYGRKFHGRKTSNGETYNMHDMTAAHKILPMGTVLLVRNLENGRETVVRVNDRGPFIRGRIIDLSYKAATEIGIDQRGLAKAEIIAMGESVGSDGKGGKELRFQDFFHGNYYIQVGSFLNQNNAENLARHFLATGTKVVIQPYITSGQTYYRVQVFAGTSLKEARKLEEKLLRSGYPDSFIFAR